jgi:hypothetical protein
MSGPSDDPNAAPLPPVARPSVLPCLFSAAVSLAAGAWRLWHTVGSGRSATLTVATVGCGFFLGRRLGGAWVGLVFTVALAAATAGLALGGTPRAEIFLAVVGAWWALRFRDDRSPANGIVALAAFVVLSWLATRGA